eukprot:GHVU01200236.1.p1 GENE.GHVU01200236.1~~GHVU01200236.1.p1  ORF type:complete len:267 (+),score=40.35 GHVU01200236.1:724-1524(+)
MEGRFNLHLSSACPNAYLRALAYVRVRVHLLRSLTRSNGYLHWLYENNAHARNRVFACVIECGRVYPGRVCVSIQDEDSRQLIVSGMGELHLEVTMERLRREYKVDVSTGAPEVAYREAITTSASAQGKYIKQSGGRGQYGDVWVRVEPLPVGTGVEFVDAIISGVIPSSFMDAVETGVRQQLRHGVIGGFSTVDIKVTAYDGSHHEVDSSEIAFQVAAAAATKQALLKAAPVLLEPIMRVDVSGPTVYTGAITADLGSRRGVIGE